MGHGVGKLFIKNEDGTFNFDKENVKNPLTGEEITTWYEHNETWNSKFGDISSAYEECRADTCGFYLATFPEVYTIFGFTEEDAPNLLYSSLMSQARKGIIGLPLYNVKNNKWGQAHTWGAYVIMQYMMQNQKEKLVSVDISEDGNDFIINLNKDHVMGEGRRLVEEFLMLLQVYKTTGDIVNGRAFFEKYSQVDEEMLKVRQIVIENKLPRRLECNMNLKLTEDGVDVINYEPSHQGIIESFADRYEVNEEFTSDILTEWDKTAKYLKVSE